MRWMYMKYTHDILRERLYKLCNMSITSLERVPDLEKDAVNDVFCKCKHRLTLGSMRYGPLAAYIRKGSINGAVTRLESYVRTHNTEYLLDAINMLAIEFLYPSFNDAYFKSEDDVNHFDGRDIR